MSYDTDIAAHFNGITGSVGVSPQTCNVTNTEPPTDESLWFVPDGWPDWTGTWIEPDEVHRVEETGRGGD